MKWGLRRYQNEDGTLTEAGKVRYQRIEQKKLERQERKLERQSNRRIDKAIKSKRDPKHLARLSESELDEMARRLEKENKVKKLLNEQVDKSGNTPASQASKSESAKEGRKKVMTLVASTIGMAILKNVAEGIGANVKQRIMNPPMSSAEIKLLKNDKNISAITKAMTLKQTEAKAKGEKDTPHMTESEIQSIKDTVDRLPESALKNKNKNN